MTKIKKAIVSVFLTAATAVAVAMPIAAATPFISADTTVTVSNTKFIGTLDLYAASPSPNYITVGLGPKTSVSGTYSCKITTDCTYVDSSGAKQTKRVITPSTNSPAKCTIYVEGSAPMYEKIASYNYVEYNGSSNSSPIYYG